MATKAEMEEMLDKAAGTIEKFTERQKVYDERLASYEDRLEAMDRRMDIYEEMLQKEVRIDPAWEPMPRERYPAVYERDPKSEWVKVTPLRDGYVVVNRVKVEFKQGHSMGTFTTFAEEAARKGIVAL